MAPKPLTITKPLGFRMQELLRSLLVVRDSLDALANGKRPYEWRGNALLRF